MKNTFTKDLLIVLACDLGIILAIIVYVSSEFSRHGGFVDFSGLLFLFAVVALVRMAKHSIATLTCSQKGVRFGFTSAGYLLLIGLVIRWAIHVHNGIGIGIGSLVILVLSAALYGDWDKLDELRRKSSSQPIGANHSPDPTPAPVMPPAGQESRHG
jgi:hypothetical protein